MAKKVPHYIKRAKIKEMLLAGISKAEIIRKTGYSDYLIRMVEKDCKNMELSSVSAAAEEGIKKAIEPFEQLVNKVCTFLDKNTEELNKKELDTNQRIRIFNKGIEMIAMIGKEFAKKADNESEGEDE